MGKDVQSGRYLYKQKSAIIYELPLSGALDECGEHPAAYIASVSNLTRGLLHDDDDLRLLHIC